MSKVLIYDFTNLKVASARRPPSTLKSYPLTIMGLQGLSYATQRAPTNCQDSH